MGGSDFNQTVLRLPILLFPAPAIAGGQRDSVWQEKDHRSVALNFNVPLGIGSLRARSSVHGALVNSYPVEVAHCSVGRAVLARVIRGVLGFSGYELEDIAERELAQPEPGSSVTRKQCSAIARISRLAKNSQSEILNVFAKSPLPQLWRRLHDPKNAHQRDSLRRMSNCYS
ncbi:MAG: hypothetical protein KDD70_04470 [Bdellovibrionales bacterium]|nr:hypothetical protein [Bdellovibrionales bacterium]